MENAIFTTTSINCLEWSLVYPVAMHFFWPYPFILSQAMTCISKIRWCSPLFCVQWVVIDIGGIVDHYCFNFRFIILYFFFTSRPLSKCHLSTINPSFIDCRLSSHHENIKKMYISEILLTWHSKNNQSTIQPNLLDMVQLFTFARYRMHINMDSCDTLKNILSASQLFSLIDMKRKFINSDNHKFHQYQ